MTYDLALYPASGPGLGHLMRCYALAEAAVEMGKRVLVSLKEPTDFGWPCAVVLDSGEKAWAKSVHAIVDGVANRKNEAWYIIDNAKDATEWCDPVGPAPSGYIYPHFGASPIPGYPTLYGEQWMPLRKQFREMKQAPMAQESPAGYKVSRTIEDGEAEILPISRMSRTNRVIVPASTVAYEALAASRHVQLHDNVDGLQDIRDAMIEAGVAEMWPGEALGHGATHIDGLGAKRILEALL